MSFRLAWVTQPDSASKAKTKKPANQDDLYPFGIVTTLSQMHDARYKLLY